MENLTFKNKWQKFWWNVFSEDNGQPSSKRIIGGLMIVCTQICLIVEFTLHGASDIVKDLLELNLIIGASLLGLSNITSIWKGGKIAVGANPPKLEEPNKKEEKQKEVEE